MRATLLASLLFGIATLASAEETSTPSRIELSPDDLAKVGAILRGLAKQDQSGTTTRIEGFVGTTQLYKVCCDPPDYVNCHNC